MIKCIVWDLDDTLWRGTLSAGDALCVNEAALEAVHAAEARGVIQSVVSRNHAPAALAQLQAFGLADYFLHPVIAPYVVKSSAVLDIAAHFNIAADSVALVDDNPFELYEVGRYCPEVQLFEADEIPLLMARLQALPPPTANRRAWMAAREARMEAEKAFTGSRAAFLAECRMALTVRDATEADMPRVNELAARAHKINSQAGRTETWAVSPGLYVCELDDIFGPHGIVGAAKLRRERGDGFLDLCCVSCRVEGRGIAAAFLDAVLAAFTAGTGDSEAVCDGAARGDAAHAQAGHLRAVYCPCVDTREGMALSLLKSLGFTVVEHKDGMALMRLPLPYRASPVPWITTRARIQGYTKGLSHGNDYGNN